VAVRIRYRENRKSFGAMMMAIQTQELAYQGAQRGAIAARGLATAAGLPGAYVESIRAEAGPPQVLGGNPRRTARVVARHRLAGVFEFGSGLRDKRPQGGSSPRHRILGKTGAIIGSPPRGSSFE
jgi:hypothetical protein